MMGDDPEAPQLTQDEEAQFGQAFRAVDKKKVGTIPVRALRTILENLGHEVTNEQFYLITADADVENSGTLDFQEFMSCCVAFKRQKLVKGPRLTNDAFEALAVDSSLDPARVKQALQEFDLRVNVEKIMSEKNIKVDETSGGITLEQFSKLLR